MAFILKITVVFSSRHQSTCAPQLIWAFKKLATHYMFLFSTCVVKLSHGTVYLPKVIRISCSLMDTSDMESPPAYLLDWSSCCWDDSVRKSVVSKGMRKYVSLVRVLALNGNKVRAARKSTRGLVLFGNHIEKRIYSNVILSLRNMTFLPSPQSR